MELDLVIALLGGFFGLLGTALSIRNERQARKVTAELEQLRVADERRYTREQTVARFREPLARAAYDLQSRLYKILTSDVVDVQLVSGDAREQTYVVENTVFLIAQYFAWTEIIRRHIQLLDLGHDDETRRLARLQDDLHALFGNDEWPAPFRIFAGEQRAIGERMIRESKGVPDCLGYAAFAEAKFGKTAVLLDYLRADVRSLATDPRASVNRLTAIQNALIDLLAFLDPEFVRFPSERRRKV